MRTACIALFLAIPIWAGRNGATSQWMGAVRDAAGKAIPGARIELRSASGEISATASDTGEYHFTSLTPGRYRLTVRLKQRRFTYPQALELPVKGSSIIVISQDGVVSIAASSSSAPNA
jgi:hypothetical protein